MPAAAMADDYYVSQSGAGDCSSASPCSLSTALGQADKVPGTNTVHVLGPMSLTTAGLTVGGSGSIVDLVGSGSGSGGTALSGGASPLVTLESGSSARHLAVQGTATSIGMDPGSSLDDVVASTTSTSNAAVDVSDLIPGTGDTTISHSTLSAPSANNRETLLAAASAAQRIIVSDSTIKGGIGVLEPLPSFIGTEGIHIIRSVLDVDEVGALISTQDASITDSVIHASGPGSTGIALFSAILNAPQVHVLQDTIVGPGDGASVGVGVSVGPPGQLPGSATVTGSIIRGFGTDVKVEPPPLTDFTSGSASATYSDLDSPMNGAGNLAVDPNFVNAAGGDYSLSSGSPVIDAAGTDPANGETDLAGSPRVVDGNGDGVAARDMGAYEYQPPPRPAPPAAPPATPPKPRIATLNLVLPHGTLTVSSKRLVLFPVRCPANVSSVCQVIVTLEAKVKASASRAHAKTKTIKLGKGHATIRPGKLVKVRIRLSRKAFALVMRHKIKRVAAIVNGKDAAGASAKPKRTYRIRYKRPRHHHH